MFDEFKNAFQRHNNGHVQLILINVVVYLVVAVFFVVSEVAQFPEVFDVIHRIIAIPAPLMDVLGSKLSTIRDTPDSLALP